MPDALPFDPDTVWLDHVQPVGLVVASSLLKELGLAPPQQTQRDTAEAAELLSPEDGDGPALADPWAFASRILKWEARFVAGTPGGDPLPEELHVLLPEYDTTLAPTWAVRAAGDGASGWQLLVRIEPAGVEPDARNALVGWEATPHQRFERLLRETGVGAGVLITENELRLVYAPRGETSGWLGFPLRALRTVAGRPMLAGLKLILGRPRLFTAPEPQRLPALLRASREAQAHVSTTLSEQVLGALHELLRGLSAAEPALVKRLAAEQPQHLYEGLLTVLLRLVFVLYAEDRDLIPSRTDAAARDFYQQGYSVRGLHACLLEDAARNPDTMEERRGAWGRLLATFRLVHAGDGSGWIRGRGGKLFDPGAFPFLEGRTDAAAPPRVALVSDGAVLRILDGLLTLKGERLSYRTLDVEQIGSVYETVMGFTVEVAHGPVMAIKAGKNNRTPVFVNLAELALAKPVERLKMLKEGANRGSLSRTQDAAVKAAKTADELAAALEPIADERASPQRRVAPAGTPILQPTDERRRTGSHYTPRSLTEPVVRYALEPAFERLGEEATPDQVLDLKVCDPAMGSGAFLVEACRALAARLVKAWARWPETRPVIPPDEDEELHARRLVAQRCLYGVDKNPMAVDLARLSLWLATLARDHEFTFLDHALKTGDSLVGLTRAQIKALHWDDTKVGLSLFRSLVDSRFKEAVIERAQIQNAPDDICQSEQQLRHQRVEDNLDVVRMIGDAIVYAFFSADKPRERERKRQEIESWVNGAEDTLWGKMRALRGGIQSNFHVITPFHWEMEFPEVFARVNPGFDCVVGNPPYLGGLRVSTHLGMPLFAFLTQIYSGAGHVADLVAYFFRRAFVIVRDSGTVGFLATNSISQGDTRESGLAYICNHGGVIYRARKRFSWPGEAAVVVSSVHFCKSPANRIEQIVLDEKRVEKITAFLFHSGGHDSPSRLVSMSSLYSQGSNTVSSGFLFGDKGEPNSLEDYKKIIVDGPECAARIFPYLGGEEVNSHPRHEPRRMIINVSDLPDEDALKQWPLLEKIIREKVKPERDRLGSNPNNIPLKRRWWAYQAERREFYIKVAKLGKIIVNSRVSPHLAFAVQESGRVWGSSLNLFLLPSMGQFAVMQSRAHEVWARFFGSSMKDDLRYTPSDCFATFCFPRECELDAALVGAGQTYLDYRAQLMVARNEGMTKTYNHLHDSEERAVDIQRLRDLHDAMDHAVLRAYGWEDLVPRAVPVHLDETNEDDHRYKGRYFWPADVRDEVLARLLALNATRAAEEKALGLISAGGLGVDGEDELEEIE